tara:strand:- start:241 stop:624 length:384 start_codon:yes stop_codon:yes gene_type:complete
MTKSSDAYKSISEVAKILNLVNKKNGKLNTHTIRFWEKEFKIIKPIILAGKRRYYNNRSIEILKKIKFLLKNQGMTIKGAKKALDSSASLKLDDSSNQFITADKKNLDLKNKITKISKLIKEIKSLK